MDRRAFLNHFAEPRTWLSLALVVFAFVDLQRSALANPSFDFYQFWLVAQLSTPDHARPDVYDPAVRRAVGQAALERARTRGGREQAAAERNAQLYENLIEPTATPTLYVVTRVHTSGDYEADLRRFQLVSNLGAIAALIILCRLSGLTLVDAMLAAAAVVLCLSPLHHDANHGNTARLQLFMLCVPLLVLWRWPRGAIAAAVAGALLGLAVMYKPNLAAAAPLLLVPRLARGRVRGAAALALGIAGGVVIGFAIGAAGFAGDGTWASWWRALRVLDYPIAMGNAGGGRLIADLTGATHAGGVILVVALAAAAFALWHSVRRAPDSTPADDVFAVAGGCLVMLVSSSLAWVHYYALAVPMALYLLRPAARAATSAASVRWPVARMALACLALIPMSRIPPQPALNLTAPHHFAGGYVLAAAVLLVVAIADRLLSSRRGTS